MSPSLIRAGALRRAKALATTLVAAALEFMPSAVAAATRPAASGADQVVVPEVQGGFEVIRVHTGSLTAPDHIQADVSVRIIGTNEIKEMGGRSLMLRAEVSCIRQMNRAEDLTVYSSDDLLGQFRSVAVSRAWLKPAPGAYMQAVMTRLCGTRRERQGPAERALAPLPPLPTTEASKPEKAPERSDVGLQTEQSPALVQVAAASSRAAAEAALGAVKIKFSQFPNLRPIVQVAQVGGHIFYRAQLQGFTSMSEARALCTQMVSEGENCFVRPDSRRGN